MEKKKHIKSITDFLNEGTVNIINHIGLQISNIPSNIVEHSDKFEKSNSIISPNTFVIIKWEAWYYIPAYITDIVNARSIKAKDYIGVNIYGEKFRITDASTIYNILDEEFEIIIEDYFRKNVF